MVRVSAFPQYRALRQQGHTGAATHKQQACAALSQVTLPLTIAVLEVPVISVNLVNQIRHPE